MLSVYVLRGGVGPSFFGLVTPGWDGGVTSGGMDGLAEQIRRSFPGSNVRVFSWGDFETPRREIVVNALKNDKVVLIGYSGGGSRATWICSATPRPHVDLLVLYDPSPAKQTVPVYENVRWAICYQNRWPLMAGLGGGKLEAHGVPKAEIVVIAEQHLAVQWDRALHDRTVAAIRSL